MSGAVHKVDWLHAECAGIAPIEVYPSTVHDAGCFVADVWARECARIVRVQERLAGLDLAALDTDWRLLAPHDPPVAGFRPRRHLLPDDGVYDAVGADDGSVVYLRVVAGRICAWTASLDAARGWLGLVEPLADATARLRAARTAELRAAHATLGLPDLDPPRGDASLPTALALLLGYEAREASLVYLRAFAPWALRAGRECRDGARWRWWRERPLHECPRALLGLWALRDPREAGEVVGTCDADARWPSFEARGWLGAADLDAPPGEGFAPETWTDAIRLADPAAGVLTASFAATHAITAARGAYRDRLRELAARSNGGVEVRGRPPGASPAPVMTGPEADRPPADKSGTLWFSADTARLYVADGNGAWVAADAPPSESSAIDTPAATDDGDSDGADG